jgi:hypothetical protein
VGNVWLAFYTLDKGAVYLLWAILERVIQIVFKNGDIAGKAPNFFPDLLFKSFYNSQREDHYAQAQHNANNGYPHNQLRESTF